MKSFFGFWFDPVDTRIFAAFRILMGILAFFTFYGLVPLAKFHYSDEGWFPLSIAVQMMSTREWTFMHVITSPWMAALFLYLGCLFAFLLTLGYRARLFAVLTFVCLVSVQSRNWINTYGGDAAIRVFIFYLILMPSSISWSVDALIRRRRELESAIDHGNINFQSLTRLSASMATGAPRWTLRLVQIQICAIYFHTGWAKTHGKDWLNGNGPAFALLDPIFARFDYSQIMTIPAVKSMLLITGYATTWIELLFPIMILWWPLRYFVLIAMGGIHLGILTTIQVHLFSLILISSYVVFLPSIFFARIEKWIRILGEKVSGERKIVLYDGECYVCRWAVFFLFSLDWFDRFEFYAIQDKQLWFSKVPELLHSKIDLEAPAVYGIKSGDFDRGFNAYLLIGKSLWCFKPAAWVISKVPFLNKLGQWIYQPMAARRTEW